jgi:hypothetical protein
MQNFVLTRFVWALKFIDQEIALIETEKFNSRFGAALPAILSRVENNLKFVSEICREIELESAKNRLERIERMLKGLVHYEMIQNELITLRQCIEDDIKYERLYHYPKKVAELPICFATDWSATLTAFPGEAMRFEISSGVDCFALGHHTAAIFHFMRVVEYGLRAMAKALRVKLPKNKLIEWSEWQHILTAMEKKVADARQSRRGPKKAAELDFYSGALQYFAGFKDMYRDSVMHVRRAYEAWEAEIAMRQVRDFMNKLSTRVSG